MTGLTLVSHHLCPYVQRPAISLTEKAVPFERVLVDLSDKPDWFVALSPLGKVPLLKISQDDGDTVLFESAVILEYLEETQPSPLHPLDPVTRARHRSWIEFGSAILNRIAAFYNARTEAELADQAARLKAMFERLDTELSTGPWFAGERFSLVDAVYGPVFRYFDTFDAIGDFGFFDNAPRVCAWRSELAGRASIRAAVDPDYPQRLREFLICRQSALSGLIDDRSQDRLSA